MNSISVTGNVGRDPESRYTPSGTMVANFTLADRTYVNGEQGTQWFRCAVWGQRAEVVMQYITKGTKLSVTGEFTQRSYTDRDGVERTSLEIRVDRFEFAGNRQDNQNQAGNGQQQNDYEQAAPRQQAPQRQQAQRQPQQAQRQAPQRQPVAAGQRQAPQRQPIQAPSFFDDTFEDDFGQGDASDGKVPF